MFSRTGSQASSLDSKKKPKTIKLVKEPIHNDWIKIHVKYGHENLAYLVMESSQNNKLAFYARGLYCEIESDELTALFSDVRCGWSREATKADHVYMKEKSELLSSFLYIAEENEVEEAEDSCGSVCTP